MNRKTEKRIRKTDRKKRFYLSILAFVMLLFVPFFVYASETKSDGNTTQVIEEENKTVRVGYFPYANFQEGGFGNISREPAMSISRNFLHNRLEV